MITVLVGCIISAGLYKILIRLKILYDNLSNVITPILVSIMWIFCFLPIGTIIPTISIFLTNNTTEFANFMRIVVIVSSFIVMCIVSLISIILNIVLNKMKEEKMRKAIVIKLNELLE